MGCAASSDGAERRRRGRELRHSEASNAGLLVAREQGEEEPGSVAASASAGGRRRGCKVAPEPREEEEEPAPALAMPGSPSFRYYCQRAAAVDALVADVEDSDGSGGNTGTPEATKKNELAVVKVDKSSEAAKNKEVTKWLRFRGLALVAAAWHNLFSRPCGKLPPRPSAAAAKSQHPCPAPAPAADARSHP
ncbi:hypothetical protein ACP70R_038911 [Stipagrostis hirtigluma subsp. patula]